MPEIRWNIADPPDRITFEHAADASEKVETAVENGVPVLYANRSGLVFLAKVLGKMASAEHKPGLHVHLGQDLDPEAPEMLRIVLTE